jgi:hypothetical protein
MLSGSIGDPRIVGDEARQILGQKERCCQVDGVESPQGARFESGCSLKDRVIDGEKRYGAQNNLGPFSNCGR